MTNNRIYHEAHYGEEEAIDKEWEEFAKLVEMRKKRLEEQRNTFYPSPQQEEDYESTIMYGRYSRQLGEFARLESLKQAEKKRQKEEKARKKELKGYQGKLAKTISYLWKHTFARLGEDWVFLALLGIIMAILGFIMDRGIGICIQARFYLYQEISGNHIVAQYFAWIALPLTLVLFGAGFVSLVAPQCIGSGIPEMKTILRGVTLKEYLTFRTLIGKVVGLIATLGAGMPLGKEGPLVHIASITATLLSKLVTGFQGIYQNENRSTEMLAAACALGVGCCFATPVGGVLFSIEVTTTYFYVRNYWRGFFAAAWGATIFRLLAVWFLGAHTVTPVFKTNFTMDFPFDPQELFVFALIGCACGIGGATYVWIHRRYVLFMRKNKTISGFFKKNRFLYPGLVALLVASATFPLGAGQFMAGTLNTHDQVTNLFSNFTWSSDNLTVAEQDIVKNWKTPYTGIFVNLAIYIAYQFFFSIISSTIPVPSGIFIPVFNIGAAFGRVVGELMHLWYPTGLRYGGQTAQVVPGGYSTVGAAAFSGAVTHTISTSVIVFELTGQITYVIPILIAVLVSNAVASLLAPSIYDSIILIKKLPYLPDLLPSSSGMYNIYVEDFMVREVKYIYHSMTYEKLKQVLKENRQLRSFPLVDNPDSMILLGSIPRIQLIQLIEKHIGRERRLQVAAIRMKAAQERAREEAIKREMERQRRPSRFQVVPAPDVLFVRQMSEQQLVKPTYCPTFGTQPKKSILKKTNSFTLKGFSTPFVSTSPGSTPYTTVTGAESRIRSAFETIFRKSAQLQDVEADNAPVLEDNGEVKPQIIPISPTGSKKVQLPFERVCDMSSEDQRKWEEQEMKQPVDFSMCHIDPAPFQLVERTSLLKVHSLFSMVGVNLAYVTAIGKLVGVVGLKELRKAIEDANSGNLPPHDLEIRINSRTPPREVVEKEPPSDSECSDHLVSKV